MISKSSVLVLLFVFLSSQFLWAKGGITDVGGGGNGIRFVQDGQDVMVLEDYWEGMLRHPDWQIYLGEGKFFYQTHYALARVKAKAPKLFLRVYDIAEQILGSFKANLIGTERFHKLLDRGESPFVSSPHQGIKRLATNVLKPDGGFNVYFNKDLVFELSEMHLAGLILHEVFYVIARQKGANNSAGVRALVHLVSTTHFERVSAIEFKKFIIANHLYEEFGELL